MGSSRFRSRWTPLGLFRTFKYTTYALLALNAFLFSQEELLAAAHLFEDGLSLGNFMAAFPATIDTTAWVILLLLFELETAVLPRERIRGAPKWTLHGVRTLCYAFIVYAFTGYVAVLASGYRYLPMDLAYPCSLIGTDWSLMLDLSEFVSLDSTNCGALTGAQLYRLEGHPILTDHAGLAMAIRLGWTDAINAATWLLVVVVLEADVWLEQSGRMTPNLLRLSKISKFVLYGTLFCAAVHWAVEGDFVDFWDALLWLVAFVFIEMNFFKWQSEEAARAEPGQPGSELEQPRVAAG